MENSNFLKETISLWPVHPLLFGVRSCETEWFAKQSRKCNVVSHWARKTG
jgi:hypothetical protein